MAERITLSGAKITDVVVDGVVWERWEYPHGEVVLQRSCPDCDKGLLLTPARFCVRCSGTGYVGRDQAADQDPAVHSAHGDRTIVCGDLTFFRVGWWHDSDGWCNHFKSDRSCTHEGGQWRPVYKLVRGGGDDGV